MQREAPAFFIFTGGVHGATYMTGTAFGKANSFGRVAADTVMADFLRGTTCSIEYVRKVRGNCTRGHLPSSPRIRELCS